MDDPKQITPRPNSEQPPESTSAPRPLVEVERVRRYGGYFVATVGWSGFLSRLAARLAFFVLSGIVSIGALAGWALFDESVRIALRSALEPSAPPARTMPEAELHPLLQGEGRNDLKLRWKKALSEVQLDQSAYPPRFVGIVRGLTLDDIRRIDQIAPHVVGGLLLQNPDADSDHDVPGLRPMDIARLKTIGILEQGQFGQRIRREPQEDQPATHLLRGTTLALRISSSDPTSNLDLPVTVLTEEGKLMIQLLDRATSLNALCRNATQLEADGLNVRIGAKLEPDATAWTDPQSIRDITSLCVRT